VTCSAASRFQSRSSCRHRTRCSTALTRSLASRTPTKWRASFSQFIPVLPMTIANIDPPAGASATTTKSHSTRLSSVPSPSTCLRPPPSLPAPHPRWRCAHTTRHPTPPHTTFRHLPRSSSAPHRIPSGHRASLALSFTRSTTSRGRTSRVRRASVRVRRVRIRMRRVSRVGTCRARTVRSWSTMT